MVGGLVPSKERCDHQAYTRPQVRRGVGRAGGQLLCAGCMSSRLFPHVNAAYTIFSIRVLLT